MSRNVTITLLIIWTLFITSCSPKGDELTKIEPSPTGTDDSKIPLTIQIPEIVSFQEIGLHKDWRLGDSFDYPTDRGIFRNERELKEVWAHMVNAWKELGYSGDRAENPPVMPVIDFNNYYVIWYSSYDSGAFVRINEIFEFEDSVQVNMTLIKSDIIIRDLNLWTMPKSEKNVHFVEEIVYEYI